MTHRLNPFRRALHDRVAAARTASVRGSLRPVVLAVANLATIFAIVVAAARGYEAYQRVPATSPVERLLGRYPVLLLAPRDEQGRPLRSLDGVLPVGSGVYREEPAEGTYRLRQVGEVARHRADGDGPPLVVVALDPDDPALDDLLNGRHRIDWVRPDSQAELVGVLFSRARADRLLLDLRTLWRKRGPEALRPLGEVFEAAAGRALESLDRDDRFQKGVVHEAISSAASAAVDPRGGTPDERLREIAEAYFSRLFAELGSEDLSLRLEAALKHAWTQLASALENDPVTGEPIDVGLTGIARRNLRWRDPEADDPNDADRFTPELTLVIRRLMAGRLAPSGAAGPPAASFSWVVLRPEQGRLPAHQIGKPRAARRLSLARDAGEAGP